MPVTRTNRRAAEGRGNIDHSIRVYSCLAGALKLRGQ